MADVIVEARHDGGLPGGEGVLERRAMRAAVLRGSAVLRLDEHEQGLGLEPRWVDVAQAVDVCRRLVASRAGVPRWVERELAVLRLLEHGPAR